MKTTNAILTFFVLAIFVLAMGCKGEQQKGGRKGGRYPRFLYPAVSGSPNRTAVTALTAPARKTGRLHHAFCVRRCWRKGGANE